MIANAYSTFTDDEEGRNRSDHSCCAQDERDQGQLELLPDAAFDVTQRAAHDARLLLGHQCQK